jgi:hypothetical protein
MVCSPLEGRQLITTNCRRMVKTRDMAYTKRTTPQAKREHEFVLQDQQSYLATSDSSSTASYLEDLSFKILEAYRTIDLADSVSFLRSMATKSLRVRNHHSYMHPEVPVYTLDEHIAEVQGLLATDRSKGHSWTFRKLNTTVQVNGSGRRAQVCVAYYCMAPEEMTSTFREVVTVLGWRFDIRHGRWFWQKYDSMRGPAKYWLGGD